MFLIKAVRKFSLPHNPILSLGEAKRKWEATLKKYLDFFLFQYLLSSNQPGQRVSLRPQAVKTGAKVLVPISQLNGTPRCSK